MPVSIEPGSTPGIYRLSQDYMKVMWRHACQSTRPSNLVGPTGFEPVTSRLLVGQVGF